MVPTIVVLLSQPLLASRSAKQKHPLLPHSPARYKIYAVSSNCSLKERQPSRLPSRHSSSLSYTLWSSWRVAHYFTLLVVTSLTLNSSTSIWWRLCLSLWCKHGLVHIIDWLKMCLQLRSFTSQCSYQWLSPQSSSSASRYSSCLTYAINHSTCLLTLLISTGISQI